MKDIKPWKAGDGPISIYVNRRVSWRITQTIVKHNLPLTPNRMSVISALVGFLAALSYVLRSPIAGGVLAQLSSILDGVDGELARVLDMKTKSGGFLDTVLDRFVDFAIIVGLTYLVANSHPMRSFVYLLGLLALSGTFLCTFIHVAFRAYCGLPPTLTRIPHIASRDIRLFVVFLGSISGFLFETLVILVALTYTHAILRFVDLFRNYREVELKKG